jgi:hypothetical protein
LRSAKALVSRVSAANRAFQADPGLRERFSKSDQMLISPLQLAYPPSFIFL